MNEAKRYCQFVARHHKRTPAAIYMELGREFSRVPFSDDELRELSERLVLYGPFRTQECFYNSAGIALADREFKFVEGFAHSVIQTEHAWVEWRGRPVDVTWPVFGKKLKNWARTSSEIAERIANNIETGEYFGMEVPPILA